MWAWRRKKILHSIYCNYLILQLTERQRAQTGSDKRESKNKSASDVTEQCWGNTGHQSGGTGRGKGPVIHITSPTVLRQILFPLVVTFYFWFFMLHMLVPTQAQTQTQPYIWRGVEYSGRGWHSNHFPPHWVKSCYSSRYNRNLFFFPKSEDKVGSVRQQGAVGGREGKDMNEQIKGFVRLRMYKVV